MPLQATLHHVQGIDVEDDTLWVTSVDAAAKRGHLSKFDLASGRLLAHVEVQEGARIHPGGLALWRDSLWLPVAEYDRDGPTTIQQRHKDDLRLLSRFEVPDHIGCLAADSRRLIGGNWDSRLLYAWDWRGRETGRRSNPGQTSYQDLKLRDGMLVASGNQGKDQGAIEWFTLPGYEQKWTILTGKTDRGVRFTNEGMTVRDGRLYLLPEDDPSRLFIFSLPAR